MTSQQLDRFGTRLVKLGQDFVAQVHGADNPIDAVLLGIAEVLEEDKRHQTHAGVIACLDSAIDGLRHAAMDYYASLK